MNSPIVVAEMRAARRKRRQFGLDTNAIRSIGSSRKDALWVILVYSLNNEYFGRLSYERMDCAVLDATLEMLHNILQLDFERLIITKLSQLPQLVEVRKRTSFVSLRGSARSMDGPVSRRRSGSGVSKCTLIIHIQCVARSGTVHSLPQLDATSQKPFAWERGRWMNSDTVRPSAFRTERLDSSFSSELFRGQRETANAYRVVFGHRTFLHLRARIEAEKHVVTHFTYGPSFFKMSEGNSFCLQATDTARVRAFAGQIHTALSETNSLARLTAIRDEILELHLALHVQVETLAVVLSVVHPGISESDAEWLPVFALRDTLTSGEKAVDEHHRKRRKTDNHASRLRNLSIVAALWSPQVVDYYDWWENGNTQIHKLRACAVRWPHFTQDFCPRLNHVLLQRHCKAILTGHGQCLVEAPFQLLRDLKLGPLIAADPNSHFIQAWTQQLDGNIVLDESGTTLKQIRPKHFQRYILDRDRYGVLTSWVEPVNNPAHHECGRLESPSSTVESTSDIIRDLFPELNVYHSRSSANPLSTQLSSPDRCVIESQADESTTLQPPRTVQRMALAKSRREPCGETASPSQSVQDEPNTVRRTASSNADLSSRPSHFLNSAHSLSNHNLQRNACGPDDQCTTSCAVQDDTGPVDIVHPELLSLHISESNSRQRLKSTSLSCWLARHCSTKLSTDQANGSTGFSSDFRNAAIAYIDDCPWEPQIAESVEDGEARAYWLNRDVEVAQVFSSSSADTLFPRAAAPENADVLRMNVEEFMAAAVREERFTKPIVIEEPFGDAGMHTTTSFTALLRDLHRGHGGAGSRTSSVEELIPCFSDDFVRRCHRSDFVRLPDVAKAHRPRSTMLPRFRLLQTVVERAQREAYGSRDKNLNTFANDYLDWDVLLLRRSFTGPRVFVSSGAWFRNLDGTLLWCFQSTTSAVWPEDGYYWRTLPPPKALFIRPDEVVFIPPGMRVTHAVYSPLGGLVTGGLLWDESNMVSQLLNILSEHSPQASADQMIAQIFDRLVDELVAMDRRHPGRFHSSHPRVGSMPTLERCIDAMKSWSNNQSEHLQ